MRHRVYGKHLGRDKDQRTTLFKGLVRSLFIHGTIQTSEAKAKAIKGLVDKVEDTSYITTIGLMLLDMLLSQQHNRFSLGRPDQTLFRWLTGTISKLTLKAK